MIKTGKPGKGTIIGNLATLVLMQLVATTIKRAKKCPERRTEYLAVSKFLNLNKLNFSPHNFTSSIWCKSYDPGSPMGLSQQVTHLSVVEVSF